MQECPLFICSWIANIHNSVIIEPGAYLIAVNFQNHFEKSCWFKNEILFLNSALLLINTRALDQHCIRCSIPLPFYFTPSPLPFWVIAILTVQCISVSLSCIMQNIYVSYIWHDLMITTLLLQCNVIYGDRFCP